MKQLTKDEMKKTIGGISECQKACGRAHAACFIAAMGNQAAEDACDADLATCESFC